ncbi:MAG TPA: hypothetical protein VMF06_00495, partial [Candidatus Limnocylindria bacterium]|nr:hypothetical protein [Candidatus Limnocylindria bacterium]
AFAASVVQDFPFSFSASGTTSEANLVPYDGFIGTVNPFNPGLGTLGSFQVDWDVTYGINFNTGSSSGNGGFSTGANYNLNDISYASSGGDQSGNAGPHSSGSASLRLSNSTTFLVSGAGTDYDTGILDAVNGASPFTIQWTTSNVSPNLSGSITSWSATAIGFAKVTYNYTSVPEPSFTGAASATLAGAAALLLRRRK